MVNYKMIFKMKKLLFPLVALVLFGCDGNPSNNTKNTKGVEVINPITLKLLGNWQSDYFLKDGGEVPSGQASILSFKKETWTRYMLRYRSPKSVEREAQVVHLRES